MDYPDGPTPAKNKVGRYILVAAASFLVVGAIAFAVAFYGAANKDKVQATDITVGNCLSAIPTGDRVRSVDTVDCSQPHVGEAFALLTMPDGAFPGDSAIDEWKQRCPAMLQVYAPAATEEAGVAIYVLFPTAETWAQGDRIVTCIASTEDKRTGSLKG